MAVNTSRSMNENLFEGGTDGKYRKARPDTYIASDSGDASTMKDRSSLHPWMNYGYADQQLPVSERAVPGRS